MIKRLAFGAAVLLAIFAAAHCNNDNDTVTGPPIVTATPSPGPGTPTVSPGTPTVTAGVPTTTQTPGTGPSPTQTPAPGGTATVDVGAGGAFAFVDRASGTNTTTIPAGSTVHWNWVTGAHSTTSGTC